MYSKETKLENVKEKLSQAFCHETCQDIEDFLYPNFHANARVNGPNGRRKWRIVQDGHGRWREINIDGKDERTGKCVTTTTDKNSRHKQTSLTPGKRLSFSSNILNSGKSPVTPRIGKSQDINYTTLSTSTRANIFPGVAKHNWFSQSNNVYSESALKLGSQSGRDLQHVFHGITRDDLGAWNEASVHHERMKKAWDVYLESLAKVGGVAMAKKEPNEHTKLKVQDVVMQTKKIKKAKKSVKKQTQEETGEEVKHKEQEIEINDRQNPPQFSEQTVDRDDDFWDFYEQPFAQS